MCSVPAAIIGVLLGLVLILPGCGDEQTATAGGESPAPRPAKATGAAKRGAPAASTRSAAKRCGHLLGEFLDSLESLNNALAVGLSYDGYLSAVNGVRSTYSSVEADRLPIACLARVASPAEQALNTYIDAANTWGDCLATSGCDSAEVEPRLQRNWAQASHSLLSAQSGLRALG
jgi:hypothetical protein